LHVAVDAVEGEALAEDVAEVEHRAARQRLERDEPEELARTRLDLRELPAVRVQLEVAREAREREVVGIAGPHQRALEAAVAALEVVAVAEEPEERVEVVRRELHRKGGERALGRATPTAARGELRVVARDVEALDAPLVPGRQRLQVEAAQPVAAELEALGGDVERRKLGVGVRLRLRVRRMRRLRHGQAREVRDEATLAGGIPYHVARHLRALEAPAPATGIAHERRVHRRELAVEVAHLVEREVEAAQLQAAARAIGVPAL